ncbi:MAG TPA: histidine phosphatase family protein [Clostridia bacterium]|nr:histidine phosphatase family protein [Clostridia bacterium]
MLRFYITRHGETTWNIQKRTQGHKDSPLSELGVRQAEWLAEALVGVEFESVYSSSSRRALQTARIIAGSRDIPVVPMDGLMEINLGEWEGMFLSEIEGRYPEEYSNFQNSPHRYKPVGGETIEALIDRAGRTMETIARRHNDGNVLVVTHAVTLKAIAAFIENKAVKDLWTGAYMKQACLNIVDYNDGIWSPVIWGDVSHYMEEGAFS